MKLRVLVIDDDQEVLTSLTEFLTREGYQVTAVRDPRQALPEVKDGRHQIALLDVRMPELDGVTLLRQIRALDSDLCVIVMTGYPSVESAVDTMKAQAFDYLAKPFEAEQLREVLARAVREKGLVIDPEERVNRLLGTTVRSLRKERELTLRQLANKTGLSVSLISLIELGKSAASISALWQLASALGVPASALLEGI